VQLRRLLLCQTLLLIHVSTVLCLTLLLLIDELLLLLP
jgi:hypothetical protein